MPITYLLQRRISMAKIIETENCSRRMIKLSSADVISVVREYQNTVTRKSNYFQTVNKLEDIVIYLPEDI